MKNFKNKIYYCTKHCSKYRILFVKKREIELSISIDRSDKFQKKKRNETDSKRGIKKIINRIVDISRRIIYRMLRYYVIIIKDGIERGEIRFSSASKAVQFPYYTLWCGIIPIQMMYKITELRLGF